MTKRGGGRGEARRDEQRSQTHKAKSAGKRMRIHGRLSKGPKLREGWVKYG